MKYLVENPLANIIDCTGSNYPSCKNTVINCLPNEDCTVLCTQLQACFDSTINCPINGNCNIECHGGGKACYNTIIDASNSIGNLNILCKDRTDHCRQMKVLGSTILPPPDLITGVIVPNNLNMLCDGILRACVDAEITCPLYGDCEVDCPTDTSCRYATITGPSNGDLHVHCDGSRSCHDLTVHAALSHHAHIEGCTAYESCLDFTLYCPPNANGIKNCFIEGLSSVIP